MNYYDIGVRFFWLDEAEPEYSVYDFDIYRYFIGPDVQIGNIYPVMYAKGFYEGMTEAGQNDIINLIRCAWAGSQRFGALVWSGDIDSSLTWAWQAYLGGQRISADSTEAIRTIPLFARISSAGFRMRLFVLFMARRCFIRKREKQPLLVHLSPKVVAGMETLVYLHNSRIAEIDHISLDDVLEYATGSVVRKTLKIAEREEPKKPTDSSEVVDYVTHRIGSGRRQVR